MTNAVETGRPVRQQVPGVELMEGAGVRVRRFVAGPYLSHLDPFLLLDEFKVTDPRDYVAGFPPHPHRGFETVTYMIRGRSRHRDSTGAEGLLEPGDVQWMTAGRGVVHSEMPEPAPDGIWGYQLWVNLPARLKMSAPRYQDIPSATIPEVELEGARVRVIAGAVGAVAGAADSLTGVTFLDVGLEAGARFAHGIAPEANAFVLPLEGTLAVPTASAEPDAAQPASLEPGALAVLDAGPLVSLEARAPARALLVAGMPIGEPVARGGPFVMNTEEEIRRAFADYRAGVMGRVD